MNALERIVRVIFKGDNQVSKPAKDAEDSLFSFSGVVKSLGAAVAALAIGDFFKKAVEEAQTSRAAMGQLALAVNNSGASFAEMSPEIGKTLDHLARITKFGDDDFAAAMQNMTLKTGDAKWSMDNLGLAADLAAAKNIELSDASEMLANAHEGNFKALNKVIPGIKNAADWQAVLAEKTHGAAEAQMQQLGPFEAIKKQFGEFAESVGRAILGNEQFSTSGFGAADMLANLANWIDENEGQIGKFIDATVEITKNIVEAFTPSFELLMAIGGPILKGLVVLLTELSFAFRAGTIFVEEYGGRFYEIIGGLVEKGGKILKAFGINVVESLGTTLREFGEKMNTEASTRWDTLSSDHSEFWKKMQTTDATGQKTITTSAESSGKKRVLLTDAELSKQTEQRKKWLAEAEATSKKFDAMMDADQKASIAAVQKYDTILTDSLKVSLDATTDAIEKVNAGMRQMAHDAPSSEVSALWQKSEGYLATLKLMKGAHDAIIGVNYGLPPKAAADTLGDIIQKLQDQTAEEFAQTGNAVDFAHRMDVINALKAKQRDLTKEAGKEEDDNRAKIEAQVRAFEKMVDLTASIARQALDMAYQWGVVDSKTANVLDAVIGIGQSMARLAGGDLVGGLSGIVGGISAIVTTMVQGDPERRKLLRDNNVALDRLRTEGVTLSTKASGESIAKAKQVLSPEFAGFLDALGQQTGNGKHGDVAAMTALNEALAKVGLRVSDLDKIAADLGLNIRDKNGNLAFGTLSQLSSGINTNGFGTSIGQSFGDQLNFFKESQRLSGATGVTKIGDLLGFLTGGAGNVSALSGIDLSDPTKARGALFDLLTQLNNGGVSQGSLGKLTGTQFADVLVELIDAIDALKTDTGTGGSGGTGGGTIGGGGTGDGTGGTTIVTATLDDLLTSITSLHDDSIALLTEALPYHKRTAEATETTALNTERALVYLEAIATNNIDETLGKSIVMERRRTGDPTFVP